jgi:hypothetical protein
VSHLTLTSTLWFSLKLLSRVEKKPRAVCIAPRKGFLSEELSLTFVVAW